MMNKGFSSPLFLLGIYSQVSGVVSLEDVVTSDIVNIDFFGDVIYLDEALDVFDVVTKHGLLGALDEHSIVSDLVLRYGQLYHMDESLISDDYLDAFSVLVQDLEEEVDIGDTLGAKFREKVDSFFDFLLYLPYRLFRTPRRGRPRK